MKIWGSRWEKLFRSGQIVARYGGDFEFNAFLHGEPVELLKNREDLN